MDVCSTEGRMRVVGNEGREEWMHVEDERKGKGELLDEEYRRDERRLKLV